MYEKLSLAFLSFNSK